MSEKVYRTAIYARLSQEDGDKVESNSIVSQKAICEDYIEKHDDLETVEIYVDDGYTGVNFDRPDFRRLEDDIRMGKIDAIICKDLSRFSRNYIDGGRYLEKIYPAMGIRFIAVNDSYDSLTSDPSSDSFIIPFKNLMNDTYSKDISVKVRTNLNAKRRRGEFVAAFVPYGYKKDSNNKNKLIIDDYAGGIVCRIFSMYKDGMSICQIADRLNEMGVLSPMEYKIAEGIKFSSTFRIGTVAKWSYKAVKRILTNEIYIGVLVQGKRGTPNYKVRKQQLRDKSEWIRVENTHEALIPYEDFVAVQTMIGRDMCTSRINVDDNLYSGFLFCADCGQPMSKKIVPSKGKNYFYYVCTTHRRHEGCSSHCISAKIVEKAVDGAVKAQIANVLDMSGTLEYIENLPASDRVAFNYDAQIAKLEEIIDKYKKMKLRIYEDMTDGVISREEYTDFRNQYCLLIDEKNTSLENLRREKNDMELNGNTERKWITLFRKYKGIDVLTRRVLMALVDKVIIHENHCVEVLFKYRDEFQRLEELIEDNKELISQAR